MSSGRAWHSSIGYASSKDGESVWRKKQPVMFKECKYELRGLEDPRIVKIGKNFIMSYAAYDGQTPRLCVASSNDLLDWFKHGPVLKNWCFEKAGGEMIIFQKGKPVKKEQKFEWSKSGAIFPEKINGKYRMLFGEYRIWWAESDDLINWKAENKPFIFPRSENYFDNLYVETGPTPIKTKRGWLIFITA